MNVFDFDKTIYNGDSSVDFYLYVLKTKPYVIKYVPKQMRGFLLYCLKKIDKTRLKEYFFCFLPSISAQETAKKFWEQNCCKIADWYIDLKQDDDIIISASPEFLLKPICGKMGVKNLIASKVDVKSGKFIGKNCKGSEKVSRLNQEYGINHIYNFYSDSLSDLPLAEISDKAFLVEKGKIKEWKVNSPHDIKK